MSKQGPKPIDVQDFHFKLRCRIQVFENEDSKRFATNCNLVTSASSLGLVFVGSVDSYFQVLFVQHLEDLLKSGGHIKNFNRRIVPLKSTPLHLVVNSDHTLLAVVVERDNCPCAKIYDVKSFFKENVIELNEIILSPTPQVTVKDINWNPTGPTTLTACKSDGTLGIYQLMNPGVVINELPAAAGVTSFSWSPKGKQIAVGSCDGKITQYKPDLKAVKVINPPSFERPYQLISLQWISNYQFIGVFKSENADDQPVLVVIDAPKTGDPSYINFEDFCYGSSITRPLQFYSILLQTWNVLLVAASNCMEVGVLGNLEGNWKQWLVGDASRAELPLSTDHEETLPVGLALETGITQPFQIGEITYSNIPLLLLLSDRGVLCCFSIVNLKDGIENICVKPNFELSSVGLKYFVRSEIPVEKIQQQTETTGKIPPKEEVQVKVDPPKSTGQKVLTNILQQPTVTQPQISTPQKIDKPTFLLPANVNVPKTNEKKLNISDTTAPRKDNIDISNILKEKCLKVESSLRAVLHQGKKLKVNLGTGSEMTNFVVTLQSLDEFLKEIMDICNTQSSEVHVLKQNLLQSWAWYEDAKAHHTTTKIDSNTVLLKVQPLDSFSQKRLADIRFENYYLQSQMVQAHRTLDEEWENFQDYCRRNRIVQIPTMEMIFQSMVRQSTIIQKQYYVLQDIDSRIKKKGRSAIDVPLLLSSRSVKCDKNNQTSDDKIHKKFINEETKYFNSNKSTTLRSFLKNRSFSRIKPLTVKVTTTPASVRISATSSPLILQESKVPTIRQTNQLKFNVDNRELSSPNSAFASMPVGLHTSSSLIKVETAPITSTTTLQSAPPLGFSKLAFSVAPPTLSTKMSGSSAEKPSSFNFSAVSSSMNKPVVATTSSALPTFVSISKNLPVTTNIAATKSSHEPIISSTTGTNYLKTSGISSITKPSPLLHIKPIQPITLSENNTVPTASDSVTTSVKTNTFNFSFNSNKPIDVEKPKEFSFESVKPLNYKFNESQTPTTSIFGGSVAANKPLTIFNTASSSSGNAVPSIFQTSSANMQSSVSTKNDKTTPEETKIFENTVPTLTVPTPLNSGPAFGGVSNFQAFGGSIFSKPVATSPFFENNAVSTNKSIFGAAPAPSTETTPFGNKEFSAASPSAAFGFGSISLGSPATTTPSTTAFAQNTNIFNAPTTPSATPLAQNTNIFNAPTTPSTTPLAQNTNIFNSTSSSKSIFGQASTSNSIFAPNTATSSSIFAPSSTVNSFQGASSIFGNPSTFVQSTSSGSIFNQKPNEHPQAASAFSKPVGFGGAPVFGSTPVFGSASPASTNASSFGGAAVFGSAAPPVFGNAPKIFGSDSSAFGAAGTPENASFGNLANQPTVGFGSLAQQIPNAGPTKTPFTTNSSFSSWR